MKKKYRVEAFTYRYGERVIRRTRYTWAYSKAQAVLQAFRGERLPDDWEICAEVAA